MIRFAYWHDHQMALGYALLRARRSGVRQRVTRCATTMLWRVAEVGS